MLTLRIGIQTASFRQPLKDALRTASELGADAVELDARRELRPNELSQTALRQFRKLLDDLNLKVCAIGFPTRRGYDVEEDLDRRVLATKEAMQMAFQLGASLVVNQVGPVPPDPASEEATAADRRRWQLLVEVLTDLGHYGERCGARLAAETGTEPAQDVARLLAALPAGLIAVTLDPGNLIVNGFSPLEAVDVLGSDIAHVHVKDAVRDLARGRGQEVPVGRGMADFPALLAALEEHDYRGYLSIERIQSEDPIFEIGQAVKFLKNI
jgi:sugar phosphate isomerase/epimerase